MGTDQLEQRFLPVVVEPFREVFDALRVAIRMTSAQPILHNVQRGNEQGEEKGQRTTCSSTRVVGARLTICNRSDFVKS